MISEGSHDTEDWSNDAENTVLRHRNELRFKKNIIYFTIYYFFTFFFFFLRPMMLTLEQHQITTFNHNI